VQATSQLRVEDLLSRLPGTVRRGHVPVSPEWEGEGGRLSTGYPEVDDLLGGGLPRGRLSELIGRGSVGTTSFAQRLLAGVTAEASFAAWVDVADAFDPASASAAGVALHRLLWVRPPDLVAAFAATEILLATGGFALVLLDPARVHAKGRRMLTAPQTWLRLARAAEKSRTALVVLPGSGAESGAGSGGGSGGARQSRTARAGSSGLAGAAAGVRLELSSVRALWEGAPGAPSLLEGLVTRVDVTRNRGPQHDRPRGRQARIRLA